MGLKAREQPRQITVWVALKLLSEDASEILVVQFEAWEDEVPRSSNRALSVLQEPCEVSWGRCAPEVQVSTNDKRFQGEALVQSPHALALGSLSLQAFKCKVLNEEHGSLDSALRTLQGPYPLRQELAPPSLCSMKCDARSKNLTKLGFAL